MEYKPDIDQKYHLSVNTVTSKQPTIVSTLTCSEIFKNIKIDFSLHEKKTMYGHFINETV